MTLADSGKPSLYNLACCDIKFKHAVCWQGVLIVCRELEKMKLTGSGEPSLYDFAVLDATWSGIAQGADAVQAFLATDGLGALLDILNKGALPLQPVILTIIAGTSAFGSLCMCAQLVTLTTVASSSAFSSLCVCVQASMSTYQLLVCMCTAVCAGVHSQPC